LIVIGGGINGAGIARDAALRGLRCLLLEAEDFGSGTSSWSTRLIHGGLRYLEYGEIPLVRESLRERRRLLDHAPHLVTPLALTIPIYAGARRGRFLIKLGMIAYDLLSAGKSLAAHRMFGAAELLEAEPGLAAEGLRGGARYYDAQVTFAERLVIEIVLDAAAGGADVRNYAPARQIESNDSGGFIVHCRDRGEPASAGAPVVINAAGPWVDEILGVADGSFGRQIGGTKGSHIVVGEFPGAPHDAIYVEASSDGRPIFILPWNDQFLVGTTDIRYSGDPGEACADDDEIAYLLAEVNRILPGAGLGADDIRFTYSGVRPLPYREDGPESAITRQHIIREHSGSAEGLISIIGGKLTTYRSLAEEATDVVCRRLNRRIDSRPTRDTPLPGGAAIEKMPALLSSSAPKALERIAAIYGSRIVELAAFCEAEPALCRPLVRDDTVLAAEIVFAIRQEFAQTLVDLLYRRLMIGLAGELPAALVAEVTDLAAAELGWDDSALERQRADLARFEKRLRRRPSTH